MRSYGYAYAPVTYLNGVGSGSTYIAEVYYDGGYIFLVLFNCAIGLLIVLLDNAREKTIVSCAIILNFIRYVPLLPRGMALDWLTNTFAIQNIIFFLGIIFLTKRRDEDLI